MGEEKANPNLAGTQNVTNAGAIEQRHHRRDQDHIVGAKEFAHGFRTRS